MVKSCNLFCPPMEKVKHVSMQRLDFNQLIRTFTKATDETLVATNKFQESRNQ